MFRVTLPVLAAALVTAAAPAAQADERIYNYVAADRPTEAFVDQGLTIFFDKTLFGYRVNQIMATQASATANLKPSAGRDLGASLTSLLPAESGERDLYEILPEEQGGAMVNAFCPGSTQGWLVFGRLRPLRDLDVHVLGNDPQTGEARYCLTLSLSYRGSWNDPTLNRAFPPPADLGRTPF